MRAARSLQEAFDLRSTVAVLGFAVRTLGQMLEEGKLEELIAQNKFNRVVIWKDRGVHDISLDDVAGYSRKVEKNDPLINVARGLDIYIGEIK